MCPYVRAHPKDRGADDELTPMASVQPYRHHLVLKVTAARHQSQSPGQGAVRAIPVASCAITPLPTITPGTSSTDSCKGPRHIKPEPARRSIEVNSNTGMIGEPDQTEEGITVTTLLNSQIRWGSKIHLNQTDITRFQINNPDLNAPYSGTGLIQNNAIAVLPLNNDGIYAVVQVTHSGDTRGNDWFSCDMCHQPDQIAHSRQCRPTHSAAAAVQPGASKAVEHLR